MQGKSINGFILQRPLGVGGMAEVWLAENKIGKKASVKQLLPKLCADDNVKQRFYTEAKVTVDLNHPNIRQVYDFDEVDGRPAIIMEYLDGMDLKAKLKSGQQFTDDQLRKWWNQLVSALNYTHKRGIVHRDIKPGNIFIDSEDNVKLLDFGIAKVRESISATQTGQKLGTLMYMSPEQVKDSKHIDYRTDLYSLAVTFVHLLTGKRPYDSDTSSDFEISEQIVYKPLDLSGVPTAWRSFLAPYLEKEPAKRPELREFETVSDSKPFVYVPPMIAGDEKDETVMEEPVVNKMPKPEYVTPMPKPYEGEKPDHSTGTPFHNFLSKNKKEVRIWLVLFLVFEVATVLRLGFYPMVIIRGLLQFIVVMISLGFFVWVLKKNSKKYKALPWLIVCATSAIMLFYSVVFFH